MTKKADGIRLQLRREKFKFILRKTVYSSGKPWPRVRGSIPRVVVYLNFQLYKTVPDLPVKMKLFDKTEYCFVYQSSV